MNHNNWNPANYGKRRPNNIDPVSLNRILPGSVYFTIPTNSNRARVSLSRNTFLNLVRHQHPHINRLTPWDLYNYNKNAILFRNPITRQNVKVGNVRVHTATA
jgi:hypothetical protein